jgi:hypothetical protein
VDAFARNRVLEAMANSADGTRECGVKQQRRLTPTVALRDPICKRESVTTDSTPTTLRLAGLQIDEDPHR